MYGYYNFAVGLTENVNTNQYYNNTSGTGAQLAFYVSSGTGPTDKTVYGNIIHDLTGAGQVGAINCDYGANTSVYKNNISNLTSTGAALTPGIYGITFGTAGGTAGTNNVYNNFISDLKTPSSTSTGAIYALWLQGFANCNYSVFNNTVYLNASSSSATTFGTAGAFFGNNPLSIDFRNNIVVNNSVPGLTGGNTVAIQKGNTSLTNYSLASGYNCLYAGTPAANRLIFSDGTNSDQTLQAFKNRVGYREQASFSELPPFVNIAAAPYDLHLQTGVATQCEKGAKSIALVTEDFDGNVRNGTNPDVGADEVAGTTNDIASPDIQYTLLGNSDITATRVIAAFATITDPSGINTTAGTNPRLYYKKSTQANTFNNNTNATDGWKYVEASNATSPFGFTIDYSLLFGGGVAGGDIIQYFVTAQDLNATPRIGLNNGGYTTQPASVNLAAANFPLNNTINQYTIVANSYTGVIPVGPAETITSLTNAGGIFSLINAGVLKGNVTISITGDLTAETGANALNQWAESGGSGYTISIVPSAAVTRTISGSHATLSLIRMDGADRVTIDGRFGGSGNYFTFRNTSNAAPTIGFINDAQNNTVRNCIIESGNTSVSTTTGGAVFLGTTTGSQGNDNNTITNNEIRDRSDIAGTPAIAINCAGNATTPAQANSGIVISDNNIHDWFLLNSTSQFAINVATGNTNFSITGNSFYQTTPRANTIAGASTRAININNAAASTTSGGHDISGNFIGGSAPGATGSDWTLSSTGTLLFSGISVTTGLLPSTIQNNVIRKINYTTIAPASNTTMLACIQATQGNITIQNNTIGSATGTGAISTNINTGGAATSFLAGILAIGTNGTHNITGNTVGGWTIGGTNTTATIFPQYIQVQGTPNQNFSISNNLVGSTSTANSIQNTVTTAPCTSLGIRILISTGPSVTVSNNIVQNVTDQSAAAATFDYGMLLINTVGSNAPLTVTNNTISNFTGNALAASASLNTLGIAFQGYSGNGHVFTGNTVSAISNTNSGAGTGITAGIQSQGGATGGTMNKNKVFNISNANTGAAPVVGGIYFSAGDGWNVSNNMISVTNGAGTNALNVYGVADFTSGSFNMFYNSVYVGGTGSGALNTYAYERGSNSRVNLKNNLLYNERIGGTGSHYAVGNTTASPSDGWTSTSSSYNTYIVSSSFAFGEWGTGVGQTFAQWKSSGSGDLESYTNTATNVPSSALFNNTASGDLTINAANAESWYVNGKGIAGSLSSSINSDFGGTIRGVAEGAPTDIGADEFTPNAGVLPPDATASAAPSPSTTTSYSFGERKLGEIIWGASVPASVSWKYYSGIPGPSATGLVINSYHDVPAVGTGPFNYAMKLYYTRAEQNNIPDAMLAGIKKNGASPWTVTGGTASSDADGNFVTSTGLTSFSLFSFKSTLNTLPLNLLSFTGSINTDNTVDLAWRVSEQSGIQKYLVERSTNGVEFKAIGSVSANTSNNFTYHFTDLQPSTGKNYYRIRIVENDNPFEFSKTILVTIRSKESFVIFPAPATDNITIQTSRTDLINTKMFLTDLQGKVVKSIDLVSQVQQVNISALSPGIYFLRTRDGDSYKIIKQ